MEKKEKILIAQTSFLGDLVLATPLISEARRRFPRALLAVLCTLRARSLLEGNRDIDEIITDDKRGRDRGWRGLRRKARELAGRGFTLAISPHKSLRTALLLFLARIPRRVGFRQSAGWFLYHDRVDRESFRHDVERNLSLLRPFGVEPENCDRRLRVEGEPHGRESVAQLLRSLGIRRDGIVFGVNPGSVWPTKRWAAEEYAKLIMKLKRRYRCEVILFGAPEDVEIVAAIQALSGNAGVSLAGKIGLGELAWALDGCDVFITNDSAPMHMAVARDVPVVAIFCATTPSLGFYPYSSKAVVVEKGLSCRPCASHGGRRCPLGTEDCMRLIKADDVLRGVEQLLQGKNLPAPERPGGYSPQVITL
jgi:heptosyltransferase-2